ALAGDRIDIQTHAGFVIAGEHAVLRGELVAAPCRPAALVVTAGPGDAGPVLGAEILRASAATFAHPAGHRVPALRGMHVRLAAGILRARAAIATCGQLHTLDRRPAHPRFHIGTVAQPRLLEAATGDHRGGVDEIAIAVLAMHTVVGRRAHLG